MNEYLNLYRLGKFAETKKNAEGKRVALHDGTYYGLQGTVAVVDYETGYRALKQDWSNEYIDLTQSEIDSWNEGQGLNKEDVRSIVAYSFTGGMRSQNDIN